VDPPASRPCFDRCTERTIGRSSGFHGICTSILVGLSFVGSPCAIGFRECSGGSSVGFRECSGGSSGFLGIHGASGFGQCSGGSSGFNGRSSGFNGFNGRSSGFNGRSSGFLCGESEGGGV
jgi:hypothetical protein